MPEDQNASPCKHLSFPTQMMRKTFCLFLFYDNFMRSVARGIASGDLQYRKHYLDTKVTTAFMQWGQTTSC